MNQKLYWYSGIFAVFIYLLALFIGGLLYPGYSHISQDVSQLTSTNSPIRGLMNIFFVYNILVSVFGMGLYKISENRSSQLSSLFVFAIGILGGVITWFPINTRGTEITTVGIIHIIIVTIISLLTVVSGFLFWVGLRKGSYEFIAKISLIAGISFLISGPIAAINVMSPYAGLYERIPIGTFLFWMAAASFYLLWKNKSFK